MPAEAPTAKEAPTPAASPEGVPPARRRALLSVSDKAGLVELAAGLATHGWELVSTGGTARVLREAGLEVTDVAAVTGAPEMLDGRVKTLHPRIHAGVLADRRNPAHRAQLAEQGIEPFDLLVVNLYRFEEAARRPGIDDDELIEEIDIGGPTLVRAAAKNHASVGIVCDPSDYAAVLDEIGAHGTLSGSTRRELALKAFRLTAAYDAAIAGALGARWVPEEHFPERLSLPLRRVEVLRYGENPHQAAAVYTVADADPATGPFVAGPRLLAGKALSYTNLLDASGAATLARELGGAAVVIVKHATPCGAARAADLASAWDRALAADPVSAFGGVVGVRGRVDGTLAAALSRIFLEVLVASGFDAEALTVLSGKPDLRLVEDTTIELPPLVRAPLEVRSAGGAVLVTESDVLADDPASWSVVSERSPQADELADLDVAWRICRRVASNAVVLVRDGAMVGVGGGQTSRVESARLATSRAGDRAAGAVAASDAFFPFADGVAVCLDAGVRAVVQPGGSKRDAEVIAAVDAADAAMLFTGRRHFRH